MARPTGPPVIALCLGLVPPVLQGGALAVGPKTPLKISAIASIFYVGFSFSVHLQPSCFRAKSLHKRLLSIATEQTKARHFATKLNN
jgi:hypothetical protein